MRIRTYRQLRQLLTKLREETILMQEVWAIYYFALEVDNRSFNFDERIWTARFGALLECIYQVRKVQQKYEGEEYMDFFYNELQQFLEVGQELINKYYY